MIVYVLLFGVGAYVVWGIIHHWHRGDLHLKIVLEYLGLAILGVTVVFSLLQLL